VITAPSHRICFVSDRNLAYDFRMEVAGRVNHGVVVLEGDAQLPEGARVRVVYEPTPVESVKDPNYRVKLPLVRTGKPGTLHLTSEMIAEILDEEDLSSGR
jgi:hypothetical protein